MTGLWEVVWTIMPQQQNLHSIRNLISVNGQIIWGMSVLNCPCQSAKTNECLKKGSEVLFCFLQESVYVSNQDF